MNLMAFDSYVYYYLPPLLKLTVLTMLSLNYDLKLYPCCTKIIRSWELDDKHFISQFTRNTMLVALRPIYYNERSITSCVKFRLPYD